MSHRLIGQDTWCVLHHVMDVDTVALPSAKKAKIAREERSLGVDLVGDVVSLIQDFEHFATDP